MRTKSAKSFAPSVKPVAVEYCLKRAAATLGDLEVYLRGIDAAAFPVGSSSHATAMEALRDLQYAVETMTMIAPTKAARKKKTATNTAKEAA